MDIKRVTPEEISQVIETRLPLGLFYCKEGDLFVGVDNSYGDAWTEDFKTLSACKKWLAK